MPVVVAIILALLFGAPAYAQVPIKFANVPLCLPPYDPPIDAVRFYCISPRGRTLMRELRPYWAPNGGIRTAIWAACPADATVTFTVVRGDKESPDAREMKLGSSLPSGECWRDYNVPASPLAMADLPSPTQRVEALGRACIDDWVCRTLSIQLCDKDPQCRLYLKPKMSVDFDQDGFIGPADQVWFDMAIHGGLW